MSSAATASPNSPRPSARAAKLANAKPPPSIAENLEKLFSHLRGRTDLAQAVVEAGGKVYYVTHPASADALFDEEEFEKDESIPYWADLWPSAMALARLLSDMDLTGKRAIELGCGVGLPSVVARERGAEVIATDHYRGALDFASHNAKTNVGREVSTALLDWREPNLDGLGTFDLVLAADVLYERRNVPWLVEIVPELLVPKGELLIADPRRPGAAMFVEEMEKKGFDCSSVEETVRQGAAEIKVSIHAISRE
ncbi:MAG: class I SAM-dependent methyltransferase [Rubrobacteraceae bacterium]